MRFNIIYIYTEDSSDGFELCKQIKKLYFDNLFDDICMEIITPVNKYTRTEYCIRLNDYNMARHWDYAPMPCHYFS